ncbi:MAG: beta-galactosidase, partial [Muribaculaceae bacterium]|nr:beta-galactosidase [Muribaculaceae bacterium]
SSGMNAGKWAEIQVPSNWEQQGFGAYTYGRFYLDRNAKPSDETGLYRYCFEVPDEWRGKTVRIVFEGSMTDTDVRINGKPAGETHQGGFTEFSFDITNLLKYGEESNTLEVTVKKESSDPTVNAAERRADWWLFGGIYRPVYLEAKPKSHIERVAVDAGSDGRLATTLFSFNAKKGTVVDVEVSSVSDKKSLGVQRVALSGDSTTFITEWTGVKPWDCEHPNLYDVTYTMVDGKGSAIHAHMERIGFRDIEFREKDGLYLNGVKLLLKGVNRHCFHPETGRALDRVHSLTDAMLIKEMNMNAVRSHYPPDRHFLDICDSIGLLYLDELPGWHDAYGTEVGLRMLREFMARDVNHPSVIIWSNGNEGGWNGELDGMFALLDPQKRHVVHPWSDFNGIDTHHYPSYQTGPGKLGNGRTGFMPTEFLHSRYDKGGGAGLEDFWAM